ncbi:MAG TPA: hypothetical protein VMC86_10320 [Gemmatimonadales bacterium]|nr:hypothetical protein [Gemmatimonadales bacterium]
MNKTGIRGQVSGVGVLLALLTAPLAAQTSLSIYSDGRVVVRKTIAQKLDRGRNIFAFDLPGLDPATLFSPDSSVAVTSAVLRPATDLETAMRNSIGRTVTFVRGKGDTIQATVLSVTPPQFKMPNGLLQLAQPGEPLFPAEAGLIRTKPEAVVTLEASRARENTDLVYVSQGVTWEAVYQAVLGGTGSATVTGAATINSSTLRVDSASVQLVAGSINRARMQMNGMEEAKAAPAMLAGRAVAMDAYAEEQTVGETHVYDLPGPVSFDIGSPLTTALFPRARADYAQEFVVPGAMPWRGYFGPMAPDPNAVPVQVWYTFRRAHGTAFGDRPIPGGTMQLFQRDSSGRVQLVGEAAFTHTPAGKDLRVQSGDAFDVTAERVQTDFHQANIPNAPPARGSHSRVTASYRVTLTNAKNQAVTVDVREDHWGNWSIIDSSVPPEKLSSSEQRFRVPVPANGTATLTYTVQVDS